MRNTATVADSVELSGPADGKRAQDLELYAAMLTITMQRTQEAERILDRPRPTPGTIEKAALEIRMALENVVLSTLITNRPSVMSVARAFEKKDAGEVRRIVQRINANYWPIAFRYEFLEGDGEVEDRWAKVDPDEP